jgi:catechol 2,3-dioxygenase-like lactoylglutathione lyase family enzyme
MSQLITGIQQVGIGVCDCDEAKYLYRKIFGMDVLIFDDIAMASLMTQYTGNELHERRAILTMNLAGGGGFEMWQFLSRTPQVSDARFGDTGIFAVKIKCRDVTDAHLHFTKDATLVTSEIMNGPNGRPHFWTKDPYGNHFSIAESNSWFKKNAPINGGVYGAVIGVSKMDVSLPFYQNLLQLHEVVYDITLPSFDIPHRAGETFRRVLLKKKKSATGAFTNLLGDVEVELIQQVAGAPHQIFKNRFWGDCGFIHLCFDVIDMSSLKNLAGQLGYRFTVDSKDSYAMDAAQGRF